MALNNATVLSFVKVAGTLADRLIQKVAAYEAAHTKAAERVDATIAKMVSAGLLPAEQKAAAATALSDHAEALKVLDQAIDMIGKDRAEAAVKQASALGHPDGTLPGESPEQPGLPMVMGQRDGSRRGSDEAFARGLGLRT